MLQLLLSLGRQGKLRWTETDPDRYEAQIGGEAFTVEFIYFARTDEVGSDRTMARLQAFRLLHDYCIGTEGFELICEMLSLGDPEWTAWREELQPRFDEGMAFLRRLAEPKAEPPAA
jgi:hypothetical protein